MTIAYEELIGSPIEQFAHETRVQANYLATRRLKVAWNQRHALINELWDQEYPFWNRGQLKLFPTAITVEPYTDGQHTVPINENSQYDYALVTVRYGVGPRNYLEEFTTTTVHYMEQYVGVDLRVYQFPARRPRVVYTVHFFDGSMPPQCAFAWIGCLNSLNFTTKSGVYTFPPKTVLYSQLNATSDHLPNDYWHWSWRATFEWDPKGWMSWFDPDKLEWAAHKNQGGQTFYPYDERDLNLIIGNPPSYLPTQVTLLTTRGDFQNIYRKSLTLYNGYPVYIKAGEENAPQKHVIRWTGAIWEIGVWGPGDNWVRVWHHPYDPALIGIYRPVNPHDGYASVVE
jgi:hypothetical protein